MADKSVHPINDVLKVEIKKDEYNFGLRKKGVESGVVVEVPEVLPYIGFHSFAFENSLNSSPEKDNSLLGLLAWYAKLVGKRVYWTALAERGMILQEGDKTFAFIKMTDIIAFSDKEVEAENVHGDGEGGFKV